jgi:hypothetical protein
VRADAALGVTRPRSAPGQTVQQFGIRGEFALERRLWHEAGDELLGRHVPTIANRETTVDGALASPTVGFPLTPLAQE